MAKSRYGGKKKRAAKKKHHRKSSKRVAAGKKAWRTRVRRYGKAKAVAMIGKKRGRKAKAKASPRHRWGNARHASSTCMACRKQVGGGAWGMAQHYKHKHGGAAPTASTKYTPQQKSYLETLRRRMDATRAFTGPSRSEIEVMEASRFN